MDAAMKERPEQPERQIQVRQSAALQRALRYSHAREFSRTDAE